MAAGDTKSDLQSLASGAFLTIQPTAGTEWLIQNIMSEAEIELDWYDGTNTIAFETSPAGQPGAYLNTTFRLTNALYMRVKNVNAGTKKIGYSGVQTK